MHLPISLGSTSRLMKSDSMSNLANPTLNRLRNFLGLYAAILALHASRSLLLFPSLNAM
eukprot:CAMPEP_0117675226 /NCGR_PEP_ID=MMETSP0804-20121206/15487_1 /TAXON_ID=1074897 /ORGANISM="Tetraselmis astigmatica, Strain CCMP880" /LENGTH=58 /DNA_ID=CAMNT_0005484205 /DNA_START=127 /DNA_END=303 /DNA_ORIENTATION=-